MSGFCPGIWPEVPTPSPFQDCRDCGLYEHGSCMIWGEGNPNAPIMVILDNPGAREDLEGNPFVCGTRKTLQQAAYENHLLMNDLYITYIIKRRPRRKYEKEKVRQICMQHLFQQLESINPSIIFCLGNIAVQSFFQDTEADVKTLRGTWHHVHGFQTAVAYHPLAVRRRPNLWPYFNRDWALVAKNYFGG